jgi:hypothetical protein
MANNEDMKGAGTDIQATASTPELQASQDHAFSEHHRVLSRWVLLVGILAVCLAISSPLMGLRVFFPSDLLLAFDPWRSEAPESVTPSHGLLWDPVDAVMPQRAEATRRILQADFPLWDAYTAGGSPLAAGPEGTFGPLNLPFLLSPLWFAPALSKLLEMVVAGGFTFLFLRRIGLARPAALIGGLVYVFSGFQVVWTNWPHTHVGAFIPGLFWAIEYGIGRSSVSRIVPLALVVAAMIFEGYPPVAGYALVSGGVYALVRILMARDASTPRKASIAALVMAGVILGVGLTSIQLFPFLDRLGNIDLSYREQSPGSHLPLKSAATLGLPYAFGSLADGDRYVGPLNEVEIQSFVGMTALIMIAAGAAVGRVRLRRGALAYLWVTTGVASLAIFAGGPVLRALQLLPVFDASFVGRLRSVLGFLLACLAAVGMQALLVDRRASSPPRRFRVIGTVVAGLSLGALGAVVVWRSSLEANRTGDLLRQSVVPLGVTLLVLGGLLLGRRYRSVLIWSIPVFIAAEALAFTLPQWSRVPRDQFYPSSSVHRFLKENLGHDRLVPEGRSLFPGSTTFYGLRSVTGHVFYEDTWKELLLAVDPRAFDPSPTHPAIGWDADIAASPILDRLSARYFVVAPSATIPGRSEALAPRTGTLELRPGEWITRDITPATPRGVILDLATPPRDPGRFTAITVELLDSSGEVVGTGWRRIFPEQAGPLAIALVTTGAREASSLRILLSERAERVGLGTDERGNLLISPIEPNDQLQVTFVRGAVVYERPQALPRYRWASSVRVVPHPEERVALLAEGLPPDTVILNAPSASPSGEAARVRPLEDAGDVSRVSVDAGGSGYLVIADALQHGWEAEVDGRPAPLIHADHALAAVRVPEGRHVVEVHYRPAGFTLGLITSGVAVGVLAIVLIGPEVAARTRRPGRRRRDEPASTRTDA